MIAVKTHTTCNGGTRVRKGTAQHDEGLCLIMLAGLVDDCSPQGKRRRSELAEKMSARELQHTEVLVTAF